jgi:glycosyltransferase involved in cell wall biosynthesis
MEIKNKPLMASEIIGAMSQPKRTIERYQGGSIAEAKIRETQSMLVNAQKFLVSNYLIDHAIEASMSKPSVMLEMIKTAIPPFKNMFIEWDEHYRVHALQNIYDKYLPQYRDKIEKPNDYLDRIGYHIYHYEHPTGDSWYMYDMWCMIEGKWFCSPLSSVVRNEEEWDMNIAFSNFVLREQASEELPEEYKDYALNKNNFVKEIAQQSIKVIGNPYVLKYFTDEKELFKAKSLNKNRKNYALMQDIYSRFNTVQSRAMHWVIPKHQFLAGWGTEEMAKMTSTHLQLICGGDIRFLISVFSILNYDLIVKETHKPADHKVKHIRFGKSVPTNEYNLINIQLPKPRGKQVYEKIFSGHGTPKRLLLNINLYYQKGVSQ